MGKNKYKVVSQVGKNTLFAIFSAVCQVFHQLHEVGIDEGARGIPVNQVRNEELININNMNVSGRSMKTSLTPALPGLSLRVAMVPIERKVPHWIRSLLIMTRVLRTTHGKRWG